MTKHKTTTISTYEVAQADGAFALLRDGRHLMTPAGAAFCVPTRPLAEAIAQEWRAQGEKIIPATMPMTQLTATALDITNKKRESVLDALTAYCESDLLCHYADGPEALEQRQRALWQPLLQWCEERFGVRFVCGCGVMPLEQEAQTAPTLRAALEALDPFHLAGVSCACESAGSLILALALLEGRADAGTVFAASIVDAQFQSEQWGEDPEAAARHASIHQDLKACETWFGLLGDKEG